MAPAASEGNPEGSGASGRVLADVREGNRHGNGRGYQTAESRHIYRDFVDATANVQITKNEVLVRFQKRAHNPLLLAAGFQDTDLRVPWWSGKRLQLTFT